MTAPALRGFLKSCKHGRHRECEELFVTYNNVYVECSCGCHKNCPNCWRPDAYCICP